MFHTTGRFAWNKIEYKCEFIKRSCKYPLRSAAAQLSALGRVFLLRWKLLLFLTAAMGKSRAASNHQVSAGYGSCRFSSQPRTHLRDFIKLLTPGQQLIRPHTYLCPSSDSPLASTAANSVMFVDHWLTHVHARTRMICSEEDPPDGTVSQSPSEIGFQNKRIQLTHKISRSYAD